ncbi:MAG: serine/threonine-protein kinase PknK, partial [Limnothrix sp. RL_2_0]|nr:serine/threonine-protein kinase PknK [Limnothrix sp. RL_2_0]
MSSPRNSPDSSFPKISGYTVTKELYFGSRTAVYQAIQTDTNCSVIVKVLQTEHPSFRELVQFRNQYTIAKNLSIPGIIHPLSLESVGHGYALVMEDWGGVALDQYLQTQALTMAEVLAIAPQLADILHDLAQHRVIHKDIKPANILIHPTTKQVKLIDFSMASLLPRETQEIQSPNILEGTLAYIAPEQTGRMNRAIDYRADFYALGVTLYQLLAGMLPFTADDPLALIHCHLAQVPVPVNAVNPEIPVMVGAIVAKLMAKNAEDRYQSALGLRHDLETCREQLDETGQIKAFDLGQRDMGDLFLIPEKLYGRETEVKALLQVFDRVAGGNTEMMLVTGFSGIGKTAVINEVHKPITQQNGYFIKGKFDQFNRNIPLSAFVQALRDLMGQLLSESDAQLNHWKAQILEAVGDNGQVLIEVIPALEQLIGQQPSVPELPGRAAQNRFNLLFQKFIEVFTTAKHPLVLFLDDLQWADLASLQLVKLLMNNSQDRQGYLLVLGAYRDNEVSPVHPFMLTLEELKQVGAIAHTITLAPLAFKNTNHLIADTLNCSEKITKPLTELVDRKTHGNPFFITQFLKALHEDGHIYFNPDHRYWQCDIAQINALALTDDVVEFMAMQLQKLPDETQQVLKLAACVGNQFDLNTLAIISERSKAEVATALWIALQAGLIIPQSEFYKFYLDDSDFAPTIQPETLNYKFLHDRVQQSAYLLIPETAKQNTHLKVGQLLLQSTPIEKQEELIFSIVQQLNQGIKLISASEQREQLARLNLIAGKKAKAAMAYSAAYDYFTLGINLLNDGSWQTHYELTWTLHKFAAETAFLSGNFTKMKQYANISLVQAKNLLDQIPIYEIKIQALIAQNQLMDAVHLGLETLKLLDVCFPEVLTPEAFSQGLTEIRRSLEGRPIASLLELPVMTHPESLAAMQILLRLSAVMVIAAPQLMPLSIFKMVTLSMLRGNTAVSSVGYATYGMICCGVLGDVKAGNQYGQLAIQLLDRFDTKVVTAKTLTRVCGGIRHWRENLGNTLAMAERAYQVGVEVGDFETASIASQIVSYTSYFAGKELSELEQKMAISSQVIGQFNQMAFLRWNNSYRQHVLNLLGRSKDPCLL